ncbi:hypothetical protein JB92DRAFT_2830869 [Gautieria morchelliformis]|nr:hypothetical protein JB92DRAFT_2830869 [Gautieria morchelliformis]
MDHCRLPQEMVDAVLDNLRGADGREALLACSHVCHAWLPSSQRNLFRRIAYGRDARGHNERLCQALQSSPHLAKYIRKLVVCLPLGGASHATCQTLSVILGKLTELQRLKLNGEWHTVPVYLKQSFHRLFLLSPISFVKLDYMDFGSATGAKKIKTIKANMKMNQGSICRHNFHRYVDCLVGPRSPLEVSHIETLLIDDLGGRYGGVSKYGDTLNRLLPAIGSSLKHLRLHVPYNAWDGRPDFDINLEFNSNLKCLHLTNINLMSHNFAWLLRFLRNIATLNQLEHIVFDVIIGGDTFAPEDSSVWEQVDCLLARNEFKLRQLQTLDIKFSVEDIKRVKGIECDEREEAEKAWCDVIGQSMVAAYPLLPERGVSVNAQGTSYEKVSQSVGVYYMPDGLYKHRNQ